MDDYSYEQYLAACTCIKGWQPGTRKQWSMLEKKDRHDVMSELAEHGATWPNKDVQQDDLSYGTYLQLRRAAGRPQQLDASAVAWVERSATHRSNTLNELRKAVGARIDRDAPESEVVPW